MSVQLAIEEGTARVFGSNREWGEDAIAAVSLFVQTHETFTSEQLRHYVSNTVGNPPGHPSAWGAMIFKATRRGIIQSTGERPLMEGDQPNGHGRVTTMYRRGEAK